MRSCVLVAVAVAALLGACSGTDESAPSGSGGASAGGSAGSQGGSGPPASGCPVAAPLQGDPCDDDELWCSYGDTLDPSCRQVFGCDAGAFELVSWLGTCSAEEACPASQPVTESSCNPDDVGSCYYPGSTLCRCEECEPYTGGPCVPLAQPEWHCSAPSGACPDLVPNWGTSCTDEGASCQYIECWFQTRCEGGVWVWEHLTC